MNRNIFKCFILINQNNLVFSECVHAGLIVILCHLIYLREFIAFAEKKVKGDNLTLLDKKRLTLCKQELVGVFSLFIYAFLTLNKEWQFIFNVVCCFSSGEYD